MIKLIILDIDGVMTNGKKIYDKDGNIVGKEFCDKDWTAIKRLKALGINVHFLSGDKFNEGIAESRNIKFWHNTLPKECYFNQFCNMYVVKPEEVVYVGDDLFDVEIAKLVGYPFCPKDAAIEMKDVCQTSIYNGGDNFVAHLFDYLMDDGLIPKWNSSHMNTLYQLDSKEIKHV